MVKGIFITATGTDIGKTYVSALVVKKLRDAGVNCGYYKPVLSGADVVGGRPYLGDCEHVINVSGLKKKASELVSYYFEQPVSPHLAAKLSGVTISIDRIKNDFARIKSEFDYVVVEGAGGLICPLSSGNPGILIRDLVHELGLDILVVSESGLGSINSAILTLESAKQFGLKVQGVLLNNYDEGNFLHNDNLVQIEKLGSVPVVAKIPVNACELNVSAEELMRFFKEI